MKRIAKVFLILIRTTALRGNHNRLYYWTEMRLAPLAHVSLLPNWYYRGLFFFCMRLVRVQGFRRLADRAIHTIPYHLRFQMA